jgi:hypothetical protein
MRKWTAIPLSFFLTAAVILVAISVLGTIAWQALAAGIICAFLGYGIGRKR